MTELAWGIIAILIFPLSYALVSLAQWSWQGRSRDVRSLRPLSQSRRKR